MLKELSSEQLATILILDKQIEPYPEPFRFQPKVHLYIDFLEYIKFIRTELGTGYDWLSTPTRVLNDLVREYDHGDSKIATVKLFAAFQQDMAFAIMKELCLAEREGKNVTKITHYTTLGSVIYDKNKVDSLFPKVQEYSDERLRKYLEVMGYHYGKLHFGPNYDSYKYAVILMFLANKGIYWSYQI